MNKSIICKLVFGGIMAVAGVATAITVYNNKKTKDAINKLKIKNLEDKNNKLTDENNNLKDELGDLRFKKIKDDTNKLKIKNLKDELEDLEDKNDKLTEENNNLKDELEDLKFTNDKLKSEIKLKDTLLSHSPRV